MKKYKKRYENVVKFDLSLPLNNIYWKDILYRQLSIQTEKQGTPMR